jgi:hypothetical protein
VPTSAGTGCGDEQLTKNGLEIGEGLPKWAGGAACGGTSLHSASCGQSHDSRKRMVQTECVILTQAAAEAGALPMCRAPVESATSRI